MGGIFLFINERMERDAWAKFRGYIYQANISTLEWLELENYEQKIELENGEDIDRVTEINSHQKRILIQVKHLEKSISLRSEEVVEAIANFIYHQEINKSQNIKLSYEFFTNASMSMEMKSVFSTLDNSPGLQTWNNIKDGELEAEKETQAINEIIRILKEKEITKEGDLWKTYSKYLNKVSVTDFKENIINNFVWRINEIGFIESCNKIIETLKSKKHGRHYEDFEKVYYALMLYILRKLSTRGKKTLDKAELNQEIFETARRDLAAIKFALDEFIENEGSSQPKQTKKSVILNLITRMNWEIDVVLNDEDPGAALEIIIDTLLPCAEKIGEDLLVNDTISMYQILYKLKQQGNNQLFEKKAIELFQDFKYKVDTYHNSII